MNWPRNLVLVTAVMVTLLAPAQTSTAHAEPRLVLVPGFDHTPVYFSADDNRRDVTTQASFPVSGDFSRITMHVNLDCPAGGCDRWDRYGTIGVVTESGTGGSPATIIELARFMTP